MKTANQNRFSLLLVREERARRREMLVEATRRVHALKERRAANTSRSVARLVLDLRIWMAEVERGRAEKRAREVAFKEISLLGRVHREDAL